MAASRTTVARQAGIIAAIAVVAAYPSAFVRNVVAADGNCVVTIPPNALTAKGLSTPWIVSGQGCTQTAAGMPTFAECAVVDPATGTVSIYSPLLMNKGQTAIPPTVPTLPANGVVGCWFGTNGVTTTLADNNNGADLAAAKCVNGNPGTKGDVFGQFATCNGQAFFAAANAAKPAIPALGTGKNGKPCYTTRSFELIDMDPTDNMVTTYVTDAKGVMIGQNTAANAKKLTTTLSNGSDNALLDGFMRPALGCTAFTAPNLADPQGAPVGALALNELQAAALQAAPVALVPPNDPMVLLNAKMSSTKLQAYRVNVNQPAAAATTADATTFCQNMNTVTGPSIFTDSQFTKGFTTPDAANGVDLFTFLGQRFQASWMGLGCMDLVKLTYLNAAVTSPIIANRNAQGVTVSLTANTAALQAIANGKTTTSAAKATTTTSATAAATTTPAAAAAGACVVTIPPNALTAKGLSTPWIVSGNGCTQTPGGMPTFAECAVFDPATNTVGIYSPLLMNKGQTAITPTVPTIPAGATVGCWFGTNGMTTQLADNNNGADLAAAKCVNGNPGTKGDLFGQFATCNGQAFFAAANAGTPAIPALGTGKNGKPCYTTRSFELIDMDPTDNMVTTYVTDAKGVMIGQNTAANAKKLTTTLSNGSDNALLDGFMRPALGCTDFTATNLADPQGAPVGALALNELQAAALQAAPVALVPPNDPMVLLNAKMSSTKLQAYRVNVNQPAAAATTADATTFCQNMNTVTGPSIFTDSQFTKGFTTPDAANGVDLFTFLGQRFQASWMGLGCMDLVKLTYLNAAVTSPIIANRNAQGVTVSLTANTQAMMQVVNGLKNAVSSSSSSSSASASSATATTTTAAGGNKGGATTTTAAANAAITTVSITVANNLAVVVVTAPAAAATM